MMKIFQISFAGKSEGQERSDSKMERSATEMECSESKMERSDSKMECSATEMERSALKWSVRL
ncbi:hypothetical protein QS257_06270 [Terrilactibacillus sp. S3-3]|nr:hypothetical protein QS257_06270 [Terrilactibacillus sp. S3-3]